MKKPKNLLLIGITLIAIAAFLKISKFEYSNILILIGLGIEVFAGIIYFLNKKNKAV
ncbi:MAG: hypothetical protein V3V28_12380 [Polaribacter sp.]|uniref:hypothetical protein n=1 Tax=Polaribacter sp. TaxID=1920175 RepID=UPI002F35B348